MARMMPMPSRPSLPSSTSSPTAPGDGSNVPTMRIPKTNVDPIWSLCTWPVTIRVHGEEFTVEPLPAAEWLKHMMHQDGHVDVLGLVTDLVPELDEYFYENALPLTELADVVYELIATVSARPWWVTFRLTTVAANSWHVLGPKMIAKGGDARTLSLAAWLDVLLFQIMDVIDPEKATMFELQLEMPPKELQLEDDETPDGELPASMEMDTQSFLSMAD